MFLNFILQFPPDNQGNVANESNESSRFSILRKWKDHFTVVFPHLNFLEIERDSRKLMFNVRRKLF
jgi:hypothetical protein